MKSTSCKEIAQEALELCLAGRPPKDFPRTLAQDGCGEALFRILVEGLADRFEPSLCDAYARLFAQAASYVDTGLDPASLLARYERVRRARPVTGRPRRIFVLSRVTLGADVAITSVLLSAAKRRFPHAEVFFVGPRKNYELFAGDPHIHHVEMPYARGGLRQRVSIREQLQNLLAAPDGIVVDPDSRLTQLGLLPVCPEDRYYLFESRSYGGETGKSLPDLAAAWASEVFGISGAKPYIALGHVPKPCGHIAVSLGVGENAAKRLPDPFEEELIRILAEDGAPICIDKGAGGEEAARVEAAVERSGAQATFWSGSFAGFAAIIAASKLYAGYDSAGQHVAAASGVPLISVFTGFPVPRMFDRWRPSSDRCHVIRVDTPDISATLTRVRDALRELRTQAP